VQVKDKLAASAGEMTAADSHTPHASSRQLCREWWRWNW